MSREILEEQLFSQYNELLVGDGEIALYRFKPEELSFFDPFRHLRPHNDYLIGHLSREYTVNDFETFNEFNKLITPIVQKYDKLRNDNLKLNHILGNVKQEGESHSRLIYPNLNSVWVNRQLKHEFNPLHMHEGLYSFVIWYDIPYTMQEEIDASPYKGDYKDTKVMNGCFTFMSKSRDAPETLYVDKKWNGVMAIFPADLYHTVNPFYSTDKERITIAGNYTYALAMEKLFNEQK